MTPNDGTSQDHQGALDLGLSTREDTTGAPSRDAPGTPSASTPAQWRLAEVQVANWGTLDGRIYRIPIARRGHLITGPSGSGKSSILDAIAAVLTPDQWLRFNAAAQGGGARSLVSYVRGAWTRTQDEAEDRVVASHLRRHATWSGIVLRYENGAGRTVSLCRAFFLRGTAMTRAEVKDLCLLENSAVDLTDLQSYVKQGIQTRRVQARWPSAVVTTNLSHGPFYARLRSVFGIREAGALQLLHRTQSAKGLDSLDQLFRHHMLERPATFSMAEQAVEEFGSLRTTYERVVDLRCQRDHLELLRTSSAEYDAALREKDRLRAIQGALPAYQRQRHLDLLEDELRGLRESLQGLRAASEQAETVLQGARQAHQDATLLLHQVGGGQVSEVQHQVTQARERLEDTLRRWDQLASRLHRAGVEQTPVTAADFAELVAEIGRTLDRSPSDLGPTHEEQQSAAEARRRLERIDRDIEALRKGSSTVPRLLLEVRERLVEHLGVPAVTVPFAAEILEVTPGQERWTGALERVLAPLSLTLLVPRRLLRQTRSWIDGQHLGVRLRYEEITGMPEPIRPARSRESLVHKVSVRPGEFHDWLQARLSTRFDYACVETADGLDEHPQAVTLAGQVKASQTRYEKDDRFRLDDRSRWVLGDAAAKLESLVADRRRADEAYREAEAVVQQAQKAANAERDRLGHLRSVVETEWRDVDHGAAAYVLQGLEDRLHRLTAEDAGMGLATERESAAAAAASEAEKNARRAGGDLDRALRDEERLERDRRELAGEAGQPEPVPRGIAAELEGRFRKVRRTISQVTLPQVANTVNQELGRELDARHENVERASRCCTRLATEFSTTWPAEAADATPGVEDRGAYLEILDRIIGQGLPEHEQRFQQLLHERSSTRIGELHSEIRSAPGEIENRVEPINESLARSPFEEGRYLRLRVKTRRSETVRQFLNDLSAITERSWSDDDLAAAEARYRRMASIMDRLASSEYSDRTWRQSCLDTREHVTFLADEVDAQRTTHATYDSGAAMSGGQQQKLVVFCLAAALRYQLASPDDPLPAYGTVVLDEAFDKADVRYTRMAMDVFVEFGFQMVLATPQKLLQTIEPYVGGITTVENPSRRLTRIADVTWEGT